MSTKRMTSPLPEAVDVQRCPECGGAKLMRDYDSAEVDRSISVTHVLASYDRTLNGFGLGIALPFSSSISSLVSTAFCSTCLFSLVPNFSHVWIDSTLY
jgi:hypothetical protein